MMAAKGKISVAAMLAYIVAQVLGGLAALGCHTALRIR
jgi:glycerol uptake facilitator-like aquaporin